MKRFASEPSPRPDVAEKDLHEALAYMHEAAEKCYRATMGHDDVIRGAIALAIIEAAGMTDRERARAYLHRQIDRVLDVVPVPVHSGMPNVIIPPERRLSGPWPALPQRLPNPRSPEGQLAVLQGAVAWLALQGSSTPAIAGIMGKAFKTFLREAFGAALGMEILHDLATELAAEAKAKS